MDHKNRAVNQRCALKFLVARSASVFGVVAEGALPRSSADFTISTSRRITSLLITLADTTHAEQAVRVRPLPFLFVCYFFAKTEEKPTKIEICEIF